MIPRFGLHNDGDQCQGPECLNDEHPHLDDTRNRWERLRDLPPAEEALRHVPSADDPLAVSDAICDGCMSDWPCDFERGRRSVVAAPLTAEMSYLITQDMDDD